MKNQKSLNVDELHERSAKELQRFIPEKENGLNKIRMNDERQARLGKMILNPSEIRGMFDA